MSAPPAAGQLVCTQCSAPRVLLGCWVGALAQSAAPAGESMKSLGVPCRCHAHPLQLRRVPHALPPDAAATSFRPIQPGSWDTRAASAGVRMEAREPPGALCAQSLAAPAQGSTVGKAAKQNWEPLGCTQPDPGQAQEEEPAWGENSPAGQGLQAADPARAYSPAPHALHVLGEEAPAVAEAVPGAQATHAVKSLAL